MPPEWADQVAATLSYGHFLCHVFHLDYVLKKGTDPAAFNPHSPSKSLISLS